MSSNIVFKDRGYLQARKKEAYERELSGYLADRIMVSQWCPCPNPCEFIMLTWQRLLIRWPQDTEIIPDYPVDPMQSEWCLIKGYRSGRASQSCGIMVQIICLLLPWRWKRTISQEVRTAWRVRQLRGSPESLQASTWPCWHCSSPLRLLTKEP